MAKQLNTLAIIVAFASAFWKKANNFRSPENYGSEKEVDEIRNSIAEREWVDTYPVSVTAITESELNECLTERQTLWDALKAAKTPDAAIQLKVFDMLFTKDGKLIKPEYSGNAGFRRASVFFDAMVQRFRNGEHIKGTVPVFVKVYEDEAERIIDQQMENELRNIGTVEVPALDKLRAAKKLFDLGCREVRVRKLYPSSTAQKLYGVCQADLNWPQLTIYSRMFLNADNADYIPIGKLRHDDLVKLNNRYEADQLRKAGKPLSDKQKAMEPVTEDEVRDYFANQRRPGEGNAEKIMTKKDIEQGSKSNKVRLFRTAFQSVMENRVTPMVPYLDHADALNLHQDLIDGGNGGTAALALQLAKSHPALVSRLKDVVSAGKVDEVTAAITAVLNPPAPAATSQNGAGKGTPATVGKGTPAPVGK